MKTGTPPRLDGRTIDYSKTEEQAGDKNPVNFSYLSNNQLSKQHSCFITYTSPEVHGILKEGFEDSLFTSCIDLMEKYEVIEKSSAPASTTPTYESIY